MKALIIILLIAVSLTAQGTYRPGEPTDTLQVRLIAIDDTLTAAIRMGADTLPYANIPYWLRIDGTVVTVPALSDLQEIQADSILALAKTYTDEALYDLNGIPDKQLLYKDGTIISGADVVTYDKTTKRLNTSYINSNQVVNQVLYPSVSAIQTAVVLQNGSAYTGTNYTMATKYVATKIVASAAHTMGDFTISVKVSATLTNPTAYLTGYLRADNAGVPGAVLAAGKNVRFGSFTTAYQTLSVGVTYSMVNATTYWLVLAYSAVPTGGNIILNTATVTGYGATSADASTWTGTDVAFSYMVRGKTSYGGYFFSTNDNGNYSSSINGYGNYALSTNNIGGYFISINGPGAYGVSVNNSGLYGSSTNGYGGEYYSVNNMAIRGSSVNSYGGYFYIDGALTKNNTNAAMLLARYSSGSYNTTGNLLNIVDSPTTSGTISGAIISGSVDATERLRFDPRVLDGASAVAHMLDTKIRLANAGAKLLSLRNAGVEKAYVGYNGLGWFNGGLTVGGAAVSAGVVTINEDTDNGDKFSGFTVANLDSSLMYALPVDIVSGGALTVTGSGTTAVTAWTPTLTQTQLTDLTDAGNTTLHVHDIYITKAAVDTTTDGRWFIYGGKFSPRYAAADTTGKW